MSDAKLCGECGCIHRPGENTLCPGWRPGPFVPDPNPKRIAAALALAEAVDAAARACDLDGTPPELFQRTFLARCEALAAYRATAPKPRPETVRDIVAGWRRADPAGKDAMLLRLEAALCDEPTAEAEPNRVTDHDADQRPEDPNHTGVIQPPAYGPSSLDSSSPSEPAAGATFSGPRPAPATKESSDTAGVEAGAANRVTDHDADQREEDTCSCPESERLHGYMKDIKFLHRQWSDEKAMAGAILTQIGNVVLRWMSNLP